MATEFNMKVLRRKWALLLLLISASVIVASAWTVSFFSRVPPPLKSIDEKFSVEVYAQGKPILKKQFEADSQAAKAISSILESKSDYRPDQVSFAPDILVRTPEYDLNFQQRRMIVEYKWENGKPFQAVTDLTEDERRRIESVINK